MDEQKEHGSGDEPPAAPGAPEPLHDEIVFRTPLREGEDALPRRRYLIYLVSGNPGLIEYYRAFLARLHEGLARRHADARVAFEVHGRSQGGFEVGGDLAPSSRGPLRRRRRRRNYSLREQVEHVEAGVFAAAAAARNGGPEPRVVLVGHSVGGYILMELVRRYRQRLKEGKDGGWVGPQIVAGICLFPTIMQITDSKKGTNFKVSRIERVHFDTWGLMSCRLSPGSQCFLTWQLASSGPWSFYFLQRVLERLCDAYQSSMARIWTSQ
jgi:pimeloyl-ACP methyl ester carboxylesterase